MPSQGDPPPPSPGTPPRREEKGRGRRALAQEGGGAGEKEGGGGWGGTWVRLDREGVCSSPWRGEGVGKGKGSGRRRRQARPEGEEGWTDGQTEKTEEVQEGKEIGWGRQMGMKQKRQVVSDLEFRPNCSLLPSPCPLGISHHPNHPLPSAGTHVEKSEAKVRSRCVKCLG